MNCPPANEWTTVTRPTRTPRKKRGKRSPAQMQYCNPGGVSSSGPARVDQSSLLGDIRHNATLMKTCQWWRTCGGRLLLDRIAVSALVCAGLGSFQSSANARLQLAAAIRLHSDVLCHGGSALLADPAMDQEDEQIAQAAGFQVAKCVIQAIQAARLKAAGPLLLFMPHCERHLYNEVLKLFWGPELESVILIGNHFSGFYGAGEGPPEQWTYMDAAIASSVAIEEKCADASSSLLYNAFNDLSIIRFSGSRCRGTDNFWEWRPRNE